MFSLLDKIKWLGHASFLIELDKIIYFDPWKIKEGLPLADIIFISHSHYDHCSPDDVKKIIKKDTFIITDKTSAKNFLNYKLKIVKPTDTLNIGDIKIEVVPAYNISKPFHSKSDDNLGFIVSVMNTRIYHCGDTDFIPEMKNIKCDILLIAVSGTYVMNAKEAFNAVDSIRPKIAIPMHYGEIVGTKKDAEEFLKLCKDLPVEVKILDRS
ncbi:MAG: MBL fold metallo-hydrolase [Candidatus Omnitrophica bacterium]|nr:MBL fold metallo-hydrolase [Candidatus Omnitrophota bacterium]MCM8800289.1 MBL fold metallo-hydrolase [Candidatus Omnitrophota bacterium]